MASKNPRVQPNAVRNDVTDTRMYKIVMVVKIVKVTERDESNVTPAEAAREIPAP